MVRRAVFLDRDGVIVEDVHLLTDRPQIRIPQHVPQSLLRLRLAEFALIVISNQTVVSRGLATEQDVMDLNAEVQSLIERAGGPRIDAFYFCPHHPNATLPTKIDSSRKRKPRDYR